MSNFIVAMVITILGFAALLIQIIIMAPVFFEFAEAMNRTAYNLLGASVLPSWDANYALGVNVFWGFIFIILAGVVIYLYVWSQKKEYQVVFG